MRSTLSQVLEEFLEFVKSSSLFGMEDCYRRCYPFCSWWFILDILHKDFGPFGPWRYPGKLTDSALGLSLNMLPCHSEIYARHDACGMQIFVQRLGGIVAMTSSMLIFHNFPKQITIDHHRSPASMGSSRSADFSSRFQQISADFGRFQELFSQEAHLFLVRLTSWFSVMLPLLYELPLQLPLGRSWKNWWCFLGDEDDRNI